MALKLKFKLPSESSEESNSSSTPKVKIKAPVKDSDGNAKAKTHREKVKAPKEKTKLKISLGKKNIIDNIGIGEQQPRAVPKVRIKPTRIPGEGYDSEAPDIEDDPLIEHGIVIRFLDDANLDFVHNGVESGDHSGINVKWLSREKAVVKVHNTLYSARLLDLPTVTEFFKTIDRKNIFKTFDVCQILLVLHQINPNDFSQEKDFEVPSSVNYMHPLYHMSPKSELRPTNYVHKDGLTKPFEDVYRRFRPRKQNHRIMEDIDRIVDDLIRLDDEAEESYFEFVDLSKQNRYGASSVTPSASSTPVPANSHISTEEEPAISHVDDEAIEDEEVEIEADLEEELTKALEHSDVESEKTEITIEKGDQLMVAGDDQEMEFEEEQDEEDDDDEDDDDDDDDGEDDEDAQVDKQHIKMLEEEIIDLEKAVEVHRRGLASATHKMMKMKFQSSYNTLKVSLESKKHELSRIIQEQEQNQQKLNPKQIVSSQHVMGPADEANDQDNDEEDEEDDDDDNDDDEVNEGANVDDTQADNTNFDDIDDLF